jgi:hypothetical protein
MSGLYRKYLELTGLRSRQIVVMVVYALSGGALGTALVTLLAETVKHGLQEAPGPLPRAGFAATLLAYLWLQRGAARRMVSASEHACEKLRCASYAILRNAAPGRRRRLTRRLALTRVRCSWAARFRSGS